MAFPFLMWDNHNLHQADKSERKEKEVNQMGRMFVRSFVCLLPFKHKVFFQNVSLALLLTQK
jgi:hypothetical protein